MDLKEKARKVAKEQHGNKRRKYGEKELYYNHPFGVAERLEEFDEYRINENIIAAAYLHDTIEDTPMDYEALKAQFNEKIAELVRELTSDSSKYNSNKEDSKYLAKAKYLTDKINKMSKEARIIKLADRENNVSSLSECSVSFAHRYAKETEYILTHLDFEPNKSEKKLIALIREHITQYLD
jgi:(p)ppGpp synthase/HD superfamily hydrolase